MRGMFITFEGGEGAGKSTQIRHLAATLEAQGHAVTTTREPGGTPRAEAIRRVLLEGEGTRDALTEALLFAAARRDHILHLIEPALAAGRIVLCDRFTDSTRAYQGGRLAADDLEATIALATGGLTPDLTILLDLPPEAGLARAGQRGGEGDRFEQAALTFHADVRARFLALAGRARARFLVLDAGLPEDELARAIADAALTRLLARNAQLPQG